MLLPTLFVVLALTVHQSFHTGFRYFLKGIHHLIHLGHHAGRLFGAGIKKQLPLVAVGVNGNVFLQGWGHPKGRRKYTRRPKHCRVLQQRPTTDEAAHAAARNVGMAFIA